jgi:putative RNA 2'-phosphotransferase
LYIGRQLGVIRNLYRSHGVRRNADGNRKKTDKLIMAVKKSLKHLSRFMAYVLGRKPDEFGLVPDENGYIKIKDFLKALCEENDFRNIRRSDLDEILLTLPEPPFEIHDQLIRATDREELPGIVPAVQPPKLLYTCVRQKSHRFTMEKGIFPVGYNRVVLSSDSEMAGRIGKRFDKEPIMLTVQVAKSIEQGLVFYQAGEKIFLAETIPVGCFTGPALPKEKPLNKKQQVVTEKVEPTPGSYMPDLSPEKEHKKKEYRKRRKDIAWKKERKRKRQTGEKW